LQPYDKGESWRWVDGLAARRQARTRWKVGAMSKQRKHGGLHMSMKHYTIEDIDEALEDQRAEMAIWRCEALRELRACLLGTQDGQRPKRSAGASITLKTYKR
jgi:hypothetical protein